MYILSLSYLWIDKLLLSAPTSFEAFWLAEDLGIVLPQSVKELWYHCTPLNRWWAWIMNTNALIPCRLVVILPLALTRLSHLRQKTWCIRKGWKVENNNYRTALNICRRRPHPKSHRKSVRLRGNDMDLNKNITVIDIYVLNTLPFFYCQNGWTMSWY